MGAARQVITLEFQLAPPEGVPPVHIGMDYQDALDACGSWGDARVAGPRPDRPSVRFLLTHEGMDIVVYLEDGMTVTAIELWRFAGDRPEVYVHQDGRDIFRTPADQILQEYEDSGYRVDDSNPEAPLIPGLTLGFTRDTEQDVPRTGQGLPVYFTSVLVASTDYYD